MWPGGCCWECPPTPWCPSEWQLGGPPPCRGRAAPGSHSPYPGRPAGPRYTAARKPSRASLPPRTSPSPLCPGCSRQSRWCGWSRSPCWGLPWGLSHICKQSWRWRACACRRGRLPSRPPGWTAGKENMVILASRLAQLKKRYLLCRESSQQVLEVHLIWQRKFN